VLTGFYCSDGACSGRGVGGPAQMVSGSGSPGLAAAGSIVAGSIRGGLTDLLASKRPDAVAELGGLLEVEPPRRVLHLRVQLDQKLPVITSEWVAN